MSRQGLRGLAAALCVSALGIVGRAQNVAPPAATPTFRTAQTLVEFTFVASDNRGNPVTDLTQGELSIADSGKARPIAFFQFEGTPEDPGASRARTTPLNTGIFSNRSEYTPGPARNIIAIVIDSLNTRPDDQAAVRAQVVQYLRTLPPGTRVAVYRMGDGVHVVHDFTDDVAALRLRIAKLGIEEFARPQEVSAVEKVRDAIRVGQLDEPKDNTATADNPGTGTDTSAQDAETMKQTMVIAQEEMARVEEYYKESVSDERSNLTLLALEAIGNHLAGIPGRKNLIWITGGTPTIFAGVRDPWPKSYTPAIRSLAERLATEGIAIYPVVATGIRSVDLGTSSTGRGSSMGQATNDVMSNLHPQTTIVDERLVAGMGVFADVTGGRLSKNTNDLTEGVKVAANDMRGTYSVSFYVPESPDNHWHDFKVTTSRPGVKLLYRRGYLSLAPEKEPKDWGAAEWDSAVRNPVGSTAIHLDAKADIKGDTINVVMQIPSQDLYFRQLNNQLAADLDLGLAERGLVGWSRLRSDKATVTMQNQLANTSTSAIRISKSWTLNSGTSAARIVVRDRFTGRYGVLDMPLEKLRSEPSR
jgi:VWFA-related protein